MYLIPKSRLREIDSPSGKNLTDSQQVREKIVLDVKKFKQRHIIGKNQTARQEKDDGTQFLWKSTKLKKNKNMS